MSIASANDGTSYANYYNEAVEFYNLKKYDLAIEAFNKAIILNPTFPNIYLGKSRALSRLHKYDLAIETLNKAIELEPNNPELYGFKGFILAMLTQYDLSIKIRQSDYIKS
ncbi:MAG: tetratricopeptide repeat protein [Rickettsia endosymbiont of Stiretrus anchorago]|nr:tetratricopeptide repeat protein [Rickettsia endosymbiont of Stiretrus anchorago]